MHHHAQPPLLLVGWQAPEHGWPANM